MHSAEELTKNGISIKALQKRMNKRDLKMIGKSDLEIQIEKEEEKRAFRIDEEVL